MTAKDYLRQLGKLDKLIENKLAEKRRWRDIAMGGGSSFSMEDRVQTSGNQQKMADAVCRYITIEEEINQTVDRLIDKRREVIETIEQLSTMEYDLLHKVYVQYMCLQEAADMMGKSYSWATTVHGRALKHLDAILQKRGDAL